MQGYKYLFAILCVVGLAGCSSEQFVITKEYKHKEISANQLVVAPFSADIFNKDDVVDDLGEGVAEDVFRKYFDSTFAAAVTKSPHIGSLLFSSNFTAGSLTQRQLSITKKEKIRLSLPEEGSSIETDSLKPEYVLFIDHYRITRSAPTSGTWTPGFNGAPGTYSGGSSGALNHQLDFAFWDNMNGKIISYGRVTTESQLAVFTMTKGNWNNCVKDIAFKILHASPFYSKSDSFTGEIVDDTLAADFNELPFYFKAKVGGDFIFHLRDKDQQDPNIPDQFENVSERPSIAYFFDDGSGYHVDVDGSFLINEENGLRMFVGLSYEHSASRNSYHQNTEQIFGEELSIDNFSPHVGIESPTLIPSLSLYGYIGPAFKSYKGNYLHDGIEWKNIYSSSAAFRLTGGAEKQNVILPNIFLQLELLLDLGSTEIQSVEVYQAGQKVGSGAVTGDTKLSSNAFQLRFSVGYIF